MGGVGINLAIQDAIAAANLLAEPLRQNRVATTDLHQVQRRRALPAQMTQRFQLFLQKRLIGRVLHGNAPLSPPLFLRLIAHIPLLRWIPAMLIWIGFRPEHVRTSNVWGEQRDR